MSSSAPCGLAAESAPRRVPKGAAAESPRSSTCPPSAERPLCSDELPSKRSRAELPLPLLQPTQPPQTTPKPTPQPPRARAAKAWPPTPQPTPSSFEDSVWPPTPQPTPSTSPQAAAANATADVATDAADDAAADATAHIATDATDDGAGLPRGLPRADPAEHQFPLKLFRVGTRKCVGRYVAGSANIKVLRWIDDDKVEDGAGDSQASQRF